MKTTFIFILILMVSSSLCFGQTTTTTTPPSNSGTSLDSQFSTPSTLTDQQMTDAKNFVHQGIKERTYQEGCKTIDDCKPPTEGFPIEMLLGKGYAMLGMFDGGMPTLNKDPKTGTPPNPEAKKETQTDYCMMAAMAYETVGSLIQTNLQKKAEASTANETDPQMKSLINLKETHKARSKTASWQAAIYGGVTACYVGMISFGNVAVDQKLLIRMGGAGALATLYVMKASKEKKAADAVQKVMDSLETAGTNCNPYTKTSCFCAEATSKDLYPAQYQEVCVLNNGNFEGTKVAMGCVATENNQASYDEACKCKTTNSCMKSPLNGITSQFGIGNNLMASANKTFDLLGKGDFDQGQLDRASLGTANLAAKMKIKDGIVAPVTLTPEQKKMADELSNFMPASVAAAGALAQGNGYTGGIKDTPGAGSAAISKLSPATKQKLADAIKVNYKQGAGMGGKSSSGGPDFVMPPIPGLAQATQKESDTLTFAEQAVSKADVSNAPSTPIFDIISNRYRMSGWTKLDTQGK